MINVFRPYSSHSSEGWTYSPLSTDSCNTHGKIGTGINNQYTIESLTRDVEIKPIHSHNDYWRRQPLFDALKVGAQSIEGDIWYFPDNYIVERTTTVTTCQEVKDCQVVKGQGRISREFKNNEIYVGHNQIYLEPHLTLNNLYFDPLFEFLSYSNIKANHVDKTKTDTPLLEDFASKFGVFYNSPETPLYVWLDFKTDPEQTYKALQKYLTRFIESDYLAYYDTSTSKYVAGPLIITITGNIPWDLIEKETKRYVFVDVPLADFSKEEVDEEKLKKYGEMGVISSGSMKDLIGDDKIFNQLSRIENLSTYDDELTNRIQKIFTLAHSYGLKTRIWGGINWPNYIRNGHIKSLWELGCDLVNVDDLKFASNIF